MSSHQSASLLIRAAASSCRQKTPLSMLSSLTSIRSTHQLLVKSRSSSTRRSFTTLNNSSNDNTACSRRQLQFLSTSSSYYRRQPIVTLNISNKVHDNLYYMTCSNQNHWHFLTSTTNTSATSNASRRITYTTIRPASTISSSSSSPVSTKQSSNNSKISNNSINNNHIISNNNKKNHIDNRTIYELLKLQHFTNSELHWKFDQIVHAGNRIDMNVHGPFHIDGGAASTSSSPSTSSSVLAGVGVTEGEEVDIDNTENIDKKDNVTPNITTRDIMYVEDLEAYMYERYLHIDEQWNNRNRSCQKKKSSSTTAAEATASVENDVDMLILDKEKDQEEEDELRLQRIRQCAKMDAASIFQLLLDNVDPTTSAASTYSSTITSPTTSLSSSLTRDQFQQSIQTLATRVQYSTILPLATSMLLVGSSVGVISPIMPFLADKLDLTTTLYGIVVSSFALSKMLGNVPSAILVERHGRKPYLVHSLLAVGVGVAGMGLATDWMQLSVCRMVIGLGVASLTTASTLTVADVSTRLSRASTFSPLMGAFAAGMAIGPAIGGLLCDAWGIQNTFFAVASSYGIASIWNHVGVNETKRYGDLWERETLPWHHHGTTEALSSFSVERTNNNGKSSSVSIPNAVRDTTEQWTRLLADKQLRPIVIMNGFYMSTFAAAQLTLLPLLLTGGGGAVGDGGATAAGLALSATAMGQVYMWMSITQVLSNPLAGRFADRSGKSAAIVAGGALTSLAVASVPLVCSYGLIGESILDWSNWPMLATLSFWSLGGTLLATSHVAAVSDQVNDSSRSQAIALLRTTGDVGYLCGAACAGISADLVGDVGYAMQAGGAAFLGATTWFGIKSAALNNLYKK